MLEAKQEARESTNNDENEQLEMESPDMNTIDTTEHESDISNHNQHTHRQQQQRIIEIVELPALPPDNRARPLAWAPTTPMVAAILIPLCAILTHGLFLYGQIAPMWKLTQHQSVDAWANATDSFAKLSFDTVGVKHNLHLVREQNSTIKTFTYSYAITELWEAKGMPGTAMPRIAAILLALFSGLWPHLKLILLNLTWLRMRNSKRRTTTLHWLSCLGKWSLADILVVCVMVGVLHIDWIVEPTAIKNGVAQNLPAMLRLVHSQWSAVDLCSNFLHYNCQHPAKSIRRVKCDACIHSIKTAFGYPEWAGSTGKRIMRGIKTSGGGAVELRVVGMRGIYAFCAAVVLSILLSLLVDVYDHRAKGAAVPPPVPYTELLLRDGGDDNDDDDDDAIVEAAENGVPQQQPVSRYALVQQNEEPLLQHLQMDAGSVAATDTGFNIRLSFKPLIICHGLVSFFVVILAFFAVSWVTMVRKVDGAIPSLLHEILGIEWTRSYSLHTLSLTTGAAGGWDLLLMGTFGLFIVFGPIVRSLLCVVGHVMPHRNLQTPIDLIGAFCAWEVLVLAVFMIYLLMPSITGTIIHDDRCAELDENGNCFRVEFEVLKTFLLVVVCGTMLVLDRKSVV